MISTAVLAVLAAAAVGGCGTAAGGTAPAPGAAAAADPVEMDRQLARCMRDNGVDWPDPGPNGFPEDLDLTRFDQGALAGAMGACQQFAVAEEDLPAATPEELEADRQWAGCMREAGIPVPDDVRDKVLDELPGVDVDSPGFTTASERCDQEAYGAGTGR